MRATGIVRRIVRRIDDLGRVVIPKEIRTSFDIKDGDPIEIFTDEGGKIVLRKFETTPAMDKITALRHSLEGRHNYAQISNCLDLLKVLVNE